MDHCWISAAKQRADRIFSELHKDKKPDPAGYLPTDGTYVWASPYDLTPDDDWLPEPDPSAVSPEDPSP